MFKRQLAISLIFFSVIMLIGHSIVPHHHHNRQEVEHGCTHYSDGYEQSKLSHIFSYFVHGEDGVICTVPHFNDTAFKKGVKNIGSKDANIITVSEPRLIYQGVKTYKRSSKIFSSSYHSFGLRAPPYPMV